MSGWWCVLQASRARCTVGEISDALEKVMLLTSTKYVISVSDHYMYMYILPEVWTALQPHVCVPNSLHLHETSMLSV